MRKGYIVVVALAVAALISRREVARTFVRLTGTNVRSDGPR